MSTIGRFLEFSVRTPDILESLHFYKTLGFAELEIGDVWPHKYAVVSDGELNIGLHDRDFDAPAISFVRQDIAKHARSMTDHGFRFNIMRLDSDVFNELGFSDRDGHAISMLEARTFHASEDAENDSLRQLVRTDITRTGCSSCCSVLGADCSDCNPSAGFDLQFVKPDAAFQPCRSCLVSPSAR